MKLVILFPDHQARGFVDFSQRVLAVVPDATIVAVLNGLPVHELNRIVQDAPQLPPKVHPIIAENATGLLSTLVSGYTTVLNRFTYDESDICVVRLDTTEHPVEEIPRLAQAAIDCNGMAIGDLVFDEHTLCANSVDEFANRDLFPTLYHLMTHGRLSFSCTPGFQAFAPGYCLTGIFHAALRITRRAEMDTKQPLEWGFDGAMALAAVGIYTPVTICPVRATTRRDQSRAKITKQFERALQMCLAARQVFPRLAK